MHFSLSVINGTDKKHFSFGPREVFVEDHGSLLPYFVGYTFASAIYSVFGSLIAPLSFGPLAAKAVFSALLNSFAYHSVNGEVKTPFYHPQFHKQISFEMNQEQEAAVLSYCYSKQQSAPTYLFAEYNCLQFVKEAYCAAFKEDCANFGSLISAELTKDFDVLDLVTHEILQSYNLLD